jgi:hypothetical protein
MWPRYGFFHGGVGLTQDQRKMAHVPSDAGLQWGAFFGDVEHEVQQVGLKDHAGLGCMAQSFWVWRLGSWGAAESEVQCLGLWVQHLGCWVAAGGVDQLMLAGWDAAFGVWGEVCRVLE